MLFIKRVTTSEARRCLGCDICLGYTVWVATGVGAQSTASPPCKGGHLSVGVVFTEWNHDVCVGLWAAASLLQVHNDSTSPAVIVSTAADLFGLWCAQPLHVVHFWSLCPPAPSAQTKDLFQVQTLPCLVTTSQRRVLTTLTSSHTGMMSFPVYSWKG